MGVVEGVQWGDRDVEGWRCGGGGHSPSLVSVVVVVVVFWGCGGHWWLFIDVIAPICSLIVGNDLVEQKNK